MNFRQGSKGPFMIVTLVTVAASVEGATKKL